MKKLNNQLIYNFLQENTKNFKENLDFGVLIQLKNLLEDNILLEEAKTFTSKQRFQKCMQYQKKLQKSQKPILAGVCEDQLEDIQVFTDSFFMVFLKGEEVLRGLKTYKDTAHKEAQYPNVKTFYKTKEEIKNLTYNITFNINKLNNYFKLHKNLTITTEIRSLYGENIYMSLNKEVFDNFITFMDFKENENITLYFGGTEAKTGGVYSTVYAINNESSGLFLPLRESTLPENQEAIYKISLEDIQED